MADHEVDFEMIMALAEGTLPAAEAAAAEAALDDASREELAIQRMAIESLQAIPEAQLSAGERSLLRASVRDAIYLSAAPTPGLRPSTAPWYTRLFPVLAGAAALVFVVGIGLNLGGGGDAADTAATSEAASEPAEAASELAGTLRTDDAEPQAEAVQEVATTMASAAAAGADVATEEAEAAAAEAPAFAVSDEFRFNVVGDLSPLPGRLEDGLAAYQEQSPAEPLPLEAYEAWTAEVGARCAAEALAEAGDAQALVAAGKGTWDDNPGDAQPADLAEFYEFDGPEGNLIVVTLQEGCQIVETRFR